MALSLLVDALRSSREPRVLATLVGAQGTTYRLPGARLLLGPDGALAGAISGGCLEGDLAARVRDVLASGRPLRVAYDMGTDLDRIWGTGMGCAGSADILLEPVAPGAAPAWMLRVTDALADRRAVRVAHVLSDGAGLRVGDRLDPDTDRIPEGAELFVETFQPPLALWIYGAGEPARPLAMLAGHLGWWVGVLDHRPAAATRDRFPEAQRLLVGSPAALIPGLPLDARSAAVVMSHIYDRDREALAAFLASAAGYIGLQGSRGRNARLLEDLGGLLSKPWPARLYAPMGLDLGAESPEAIALAVLAEVHGVLSDHGCGHLRDRSGPVHLHRP